jgi:hypothetical protein
MRVRKRREGEEMAAAMAAVRVDYMWIMNDGNFVS